jgi:hypothetical protein
MKGLFLVGSTHDGDGLKVAVAKGVAMIDDWPNRGGCSAFSPKLDWPN